MKSELCAVGYPMFIAKCGTSSALGFSAKVAFSSAIWYILLNCVINEEK